MDEPVVAEFSIYYYVASLGGVIAFLAIPAIAIYGSIYYHETGWNLISTLILSALAVIISFFYFLYDLMTKITVDSKGISLDYLFGKKTMIAYDDITNVGTYRDNNDKAIYLIYGSVNYQKFIIELKSGKRIGLSAGECNNYDEIKAAIYKYKLGIGA